MKDEIREDIELKLKKIWELSDLIKKLAVKNSEESLDICEYCGEIKGLAINLSKDIYYV